jgi:hypothetical protein
VLVQADKQREVYLGLRKIALQYKSSAEVCGVLMEMGLSKGEMTLVALDEGAVNLYTSSGGGYIGMGTHREPQEASEELLQMAPAFLTYCEPVSGYPLPREGYTRFYLIARNGIFSAEESTEVLGSQKHPLSSLFQACHNLLSAIRVVADRKRAETPPRKPN